MLLRQLFQLGFDLKHLGELVGVAHFRGVGAFGGRVQLGCETLDLRVCQVNLVVSLVDRFLGGFELLVEEETLLLWRPGLASQLGGLLFELLRQPEDAIHLPRAVGVCLRHIVMLLGLLLKLSSLLLECLHMPFRWLLFCFRIHLFIRHIVNIPIVGTITACTRRHLVALDVLGREWLGNVRMRSTCGNLCIGG